MKNVSIFVTALAALSVMGMLAGCGPKEEATTGTPSTAASPATTIATPDAGAAKTVAVSTGLPKGTLKVGGRAVCAVCSVKEGTKETEEVKADLDYKDKTYGFCNESEKAEFISNPAKYAL
jgi:YHS domain-containing protein